MKTIAQNEERKQPKIKTEMSGKGLTVHAGLLPVVTFMEKLLFRKAKFASGYIVFSVRITAIDQSLFSCWYRPIWNSLGCRRRSFLCFRQYAVSVISCLHPGRNDCGCDGSFIFIPRCLCAIYNSCYCTLYLSYIHSSKS